MPELSRTIVVAVTALLKVAVLFSSPLLAPVILIVGTVTASWNNAAPALLVVPTVKVSAATVPVKVTVAGAPSALSMTLILVVSPPAASAMVPVTDFASVASNNKVPELVIVPVTLSLNVVVLLAALLIAVASTLPLKVVLSSISINANEYDELPTVVVKVVPPVLVICTVPTPSLAPSTDPVTVIAAGVPAEATNNLALELTTADVFKVTLFLKVAVLVAAISKLSTVTAPVYVEVSLISNVPILVPPMVPLNVLLAPVT